MMLEFFQKRPRLAATIALAFPSLLGLVTLVLVPGLGAHLKLWPLLFPASVALALPAAAVLLGIWLLKPLPPGPARWEVFVRAMPETVWDTYLMHVKQAQYRPGSRIIASERIADAPPTFRVTTQMDFLPDPTVEIQRFEVYEPPLHFAYVSEAELGGKRVAGREEGWLEAVPGGTMLKVTNWTEGNRPWFAEKLAWSRVNRNMRALAAYCEGRPVAAPRAPLGPSWVSRYGFWLIILLFLAGKWLKLPGWVLPMSACAWTAWVTLRWGLMMRRIF